MSSVARFALSEGAADADLFCMQRLVPSLRGIFSALTRSEGGLAPAALNARADPEADASVVSISAGAPAAGMEAGQGAAGAAGGVNPLAAARSDAARMKDAARVEAARILSSARRDAEEARAAGASALAAAREEAARVLAAAEHAAEATRAGAREELDAARRDSGGTRAEGASLRGGGEAPRSSVSVFFHAELARATRSFAAEERLGSGGFGEVFRASGLRGFAPACQLAVKRLDPDSLQGQAEFLQEVQVLGGCRHENLLPLIGFSADGGEGARVCLVFPLMQGGSLHDRLFPAPGRDPEPLAWPARLRVGVSVGEALDYLHTPDPAACKPAILHRDIKPANILLDADGLVRLADVGLAKMQRGDSTHVSLSAVAGTNGFMDPDYMQTGHYDAASDAYSLGITVLMLLTGWPACEAGATVFNRCDGEDAMAVADRAAEWPPEHAAEMLRVGLGLAEPRKRARMQVSEALAALKRLQAAEAQGVEDHDVVERECLICRAAPKSARLGCGHSTYCRSCLPLAMARPNPTCPYCRRPVAPHGVVEADDIAQQDTFVMPLNTPVG